jgi:endo-1,3-1,4-beta-glycanase ExoK
MRFNKTITMLVTAIGMTTMSATAYGQALLTDDFSGTGAPDSSKWTVRTGSNGDFFGCTFEPKQVSVGGGSLSLNVDASANPKKCGEIKSVKQFTYGKYLILMTPSKFAGGNSAFFLYTGSTGGAADHFEIDIEIIKGGTVLHTNYFIKGSDSAGANAKDYFAGPGPFQVGIEWRETFIRWFYVNGAGKEIDYRKVNVKMPNKMNLFMNHWISNNNNADSVGFLGKNNGSGGVAKYDKVEVYP